MLWLLRAQSFELGEMNNRLMLLYCGFKRHLKRIVCRKFDTFLSKNQIALRKFETDLPKFRNNARKFVRIFELYFADKAVISECVKTIAASKIRGRFVQVSCPSKFRCFSLLFAEFRRNSSKFALITFAQYCTPKGLSIQDTYKCTLYTLLRTNITFLSGEYITKIGARIIQLNKKHFKHHKMGKLKLESYLINKQQPIKSHGVNTCVIDYIWDQVWG